MDPYIVRIPTSALNAKRSSLSISGVGHRYVIKALEEDANSVRIYCAVAQFKTRGFLYFIHRRVRANVKKLIQSCRRTFFSASLGPNEIELRSHRNRAR